MGSIMGPSLDKISVVYIFWQHCQKTCWTLSTATVLWVHELDILEVGYIHTIQNYAFECCADVPSITLRQTCLHQRNRSGLEIFWYLQPRKGWERHVMLPFLNAVLRTVRLLASAYSPPLFCVCSWIFALCALGFVVLIEVKYKFSHVISLE